MDVEGAGNIMLSQENSTRSGSQKLKCPYVLQPGVFSRPRPLSRPDYASRWGHVLTGLLCGYASLFTPLDNLAMAVPQAAPQNRLDGAPAVSSMQFEQFVGTQGNVFQTSPVQTSPAGTNLTGARLTAAPLTGAISASLPSSVPAGTVSYAEALARGVQIQSESLPAPQAFPVQNHGGSLQIPSGNSRSPNAFPASPAMTPAYPAVPAQGPSISPDPRSLSSSMDRPSLSSQPAVASYIPDENEELPQYNWGGAWWESPTSGALRPLLTSNEERVRRIEIEQLIWLSTQYSQRVKSIVKVPQIQSTEIDIARGEFDPTRFAQSKYNDTSDPVGSTLTTGGPNRLNESLWENSLGIRDRNTYGGRAEFAQAINGHDSNSLFFVPQNQVDSKLRLNYTQPLMRGAGTTYNTSAITIQEFKTSGALALANQELQEHAIRIHNTYWDLVLARFMMVQSINAKWRFEDIRRRLQDREGVDLLRMHLHRVDRSIAEQDATIAEQKAKMRGLQANLAALVGAPELQRTECEELIPASLPVASLPPSEMLHDEYYNVLMYRGDLQEIRNEISVASVQRQMAYNEVKPTLDLILDGYLRGLEGDNRVFDSYMRQFNTGSPSYGAGLIYQSPYRNRAAKANQLGRSIALEKLTHDFEFKLMEASSHVFHAIERTKGTYLGIYAALRAAEAAVAEVESYDARLGDFFHEPASTSSLLNDLIDAETRLLATERQLAAKQVDHMQALIQIKYESGTLLNLSYD